MITTTLTLSLAIMGIYIAFQWPGMIFRPVKDWLDGYLPLWATKPLYNCPTCMASVWTLAYFAVYGHHFMPAIDLVILIPSVAFVNTLWCCLLNKISDYGC